MSNCDRQGFTIPLIQIYYFVVKFTIFFFSFLLVLISILILKDSARRLKEMENKATLHCRVGGFEHKHSTHDEVKECNRVYLEKEKQENTISRIKKEIELKKVELKKEITKLDKARVDLKIQREISKQKEVEQHKKRITELENLIQEGSKYFHQLETKPNGPEKKSLVMKACKMLAITAN